VQLAAKEPHPAFVQGTFCIPILRTDRASTGLLKRIAVIREQAPCQDGCSQNTMMSRQTQDARKTVQAFSNHSWSKSQAS
jgi:hypothetical protein